LTGQDRKWLIRFSNFDEILENFISANIGGKRFKSNTLDEFLGLRLRRRIERREIVSD
jgi:hypothetical protein